MAVSRCMGVRGNCFFEATFYPWGKGVILVKSFLFTNWSCVASALGQCFHSVSQTFLLILFQHQERYTSSNYLMEEAWESTDNPTEKFQSPGHWRQNETGEEEVRDGGAGAAGRGAGMGEDAPGSDPHGVLMSRKSPNRCLLGHLHHPHQFLSFRMGRGALFLLRVRLGAPGSFSCCPAHQPRSAGSQWSPSLGRANRPPWPWWPWKHL